MITKIQSFSDVITNSSSSVFVMNETDANYYGDLAHTEGCIDVERITMDWLYDEESFSKNIILTPNKVQITPSSFNLNPIEVIEL